MRLGVAGIKVEHTDIYISYLPLAHIFERVAMATVISSGGAIGFYSGDAKELVNDIQELKPTIMCGVPRIFERIYAAINAQIDTSGFITKKLFHAGKKKTFDWFIELFFLAYNKKAKNFDNPDLLFEQAEKQTTFWNKIVFSKLKNRLGGSVRIIISGAAPLSPQIHQFIKVCFGCPVIQGYGLTGENNRLSNLTKFF